MELLLASNNPNKARELQRIMTAAAIVLPAERGITFDHEETGSTYLENALGKALRLFQDTGIPTLADDSGLAVDALDGRPGVYSARFGARELGRSLNDEERIEYLLSLLAGCENRSAVFVCCMVLILDRNRVYTVQESLEGQIARRPSGTGGFGYDPVFYLPEHQRTTAELSDHEKDAVSHRGRASRLIATLLQNRHD